LTFEDRLDSLINYHTERLWPGADWRLIKAQVAVESAFRPKAVSPSGAVGLLQLMRTTDVSVDGDFDGFDIEGNLDNGIRYLKEQFDRFGEIPEPSEKIRFALAAYNGGRGYVNRALALARQTEPTGWQRWEVAQKFLAEPTCQVNGKRPDHRQMRGYVERVMTRLERYRAGEGA
jgi:membrane-bound lytic murein transglycosylase F